MPRRTPPSRWLRSSPLARLPRYRSPRAGDQRHAKMFTDKEELAAFWCEWKDFVNTLRVPVPEPVPEPVPVPVPVPKPAHAPEPLPEPAPVVRHIVPAPKPASAPGSLSHHVALLVAEAAVKRRDTCPMGILPLTDFSVLLVPACGHVCGPEARPLVKCMLCAGPLVWTEIQASELELGPDSK